MLSEVRPTRAARGARSVRVAIIASAVAAAACALSASSAHAADLTFTGGGPLTTGTYNTGLSREITLQYLTWDTTATNNGNWGGVTYASGDNVAFGLASGTYLIALPTNTNPSSMTFTGGATYDFLRASSSSTSNNNATYGAAAPVGAGVDSFGSSSPFSTSNNTSITLASTYTGKVIFENRAGSNAGYTGTINVNGGTLEIKDVGALPAITNTNPNLTLGGGTFAIAINTQPDVVYTFQQGNRNPGSTNLGGTLTVASSSTLANSATDAYGRAREQSNLWQGAIPIAAGQTLTVFTGGGTLVGGGNVSGGGLSGTGTLLIGSDANLAAGGSAGNNRLRLGTPQTFAPGSTTINFDLGTNGILENSAAIAATPAVTNFGSLTGAANTILRGTSNAASATGGSTTLRAGANDATTTFNGTIANGVASNAGGGTGTATNTGGTRVPTTLAPVSARAVANANFAKAGAGTLTLTGRNTYGGTTAVEAGTLVASNAAALGDGTGAVSVASGATLDLRNTPTAGKSFVLNGGSLVNNGGSAVTLNSGASASFNSASATGGSGMWTGEGRTATVSLSGGGGTGATADVLLQLGWVRGQGGDGSLAGSGYTKEPLITFSNPDLSIPGARPAKAVAYLNNSGSVAGIFINDPGYGYTSVPTLTVDNTGTGGTGFSPVFSMTGSGIRVTNAGSGYTSAPTLTFGGTGYEPSTAVGVGGFGSVTLAAASNVGGSGSLTINPGITGAFGLTKVGNGTTSLAGANAYTTTAVTGGTLATIGTGTLGSGDVTVTAGALSIGNAASIADAAGLIFSPSASIVLAGVGGSEVLASITNSATNASITSGGVYTAAMLNSFFGVTSFSSLAGETVTIGTAIPEPVTLGAIAGLGLLVAGRRRRTA